MQEVGRETRFLGVDIKAMPKATACLLTAVVLLTAEGNGFALTISTVQFASARYNVNEHGGIVTLGVERIGEPGATAYVEYATRNGSATNGEDYIEQSGYLYFDGATNLTIVIPILNDAAAEPDETFSVTLFNPDPVDTQLGDVTEAVVTIGDDERVEFSASSFTVDEGASMAVITVRGHSDATNGFLVDYSTVDQGGVTRGANYLPQSGTLTFGSDETERTFLVPILDDAVGEGNEVVGLRLYDPVGVIVGAQSSAVLRILDNDGIVEFSASRFFLDEGVGTAVITVRRTDASTKVFSVDYSTIDGCSASAGADYLPQSGTLTFAAGETEKMLLIPILDDPLVEGDETVNLTLSHPVGAALGVRTNVLLVIRDNDQAHIAGEGVTPRRLGIWSGIASPTKVVVAGDYVYMADYQSGLMVIDATDVANPRLISRAGTQAAGVSIACNHAFVTGWGGLRAFDVSDPANPRQVGQYDRGCRPPTAVDAEGSVAVLSVLPDPYCGGGDVGGIDIIDISEPSSLRLLGTYRRDDAWPFRYWGVWDVAVAGGFAYLDTGIPQVQVIDIRDPGHPYKLADYGFDANAPDFGLDDLEVSGNELYLSREGSLEVVDIRSLASPQGGSVVGRADVPMAGLVVAGGRLCGVGAGGLHVIDVRDPANPRPVSFYPTDAPAYAVAVSGDRAYLATATGLEILDLNPLVFLPASIKRLADGKVTFTLNTLPGRSYTVQASSNLMHWESLDTRIASDIQLIFIHSNAPHFDRRFFRAVAR